MTEREALVKELERVVHCSHLEKVADFILAREAGLREELAGYRRRGLGENISHEITRLRSALEMIGEFGSDTPMSEVYKAVDAALQGGSDGQD